MSSKVRCAILGAGALGMNVLHRLRRSPELELAWMVDEPSAADALAEAAKLGVRVSENSVRGMIPHVVADSVRVAFLTEPFEQDANDVHTLGALGVLVIDLLRTQGAPLYIPAISASDYAAWDPRYLRVAPAILQVAAPLVRAISQVQKVVHAQVFGSLLVSFPVPGRTEGADSWSSVTASDLISVARVSSASGAVTLSPTLNPSNELWCSITCVTDSELQQARVKAALENMAAQLRRYLPTLSLEIQTLLSGRRSVVMATLEFGGVELAGRAWESDILAATAISTAEAFAGRIGAIRRLSSDFDFLPT